MDMTKEQVDKLSLEIMTLGLELGSVNTGQLARFGKSLASPRTHQRLVVRRDAHFRGTSLNKAQPEHRSGTTSQEPTQPVSMPLTREEIFVRLQKAAGAGMWEWSLAGRFATQPESILKLLPYAVCAKYGLPRALSDGVQKSAAAGDEPLTRGDIQRRIERAVQGGALEPRV